MPKDEQNQSDSEFQAFESLKKLIKVPQHELKEKIEEEQNEKDDPAIEPESDNSDRSTRE